MSIASKYNKSNKFNYKIPENAEYITLQNAKESCYIINAIYINKKSMYGEHPVFCSNNLLFDIPKHMNDIVKEMLNDDLVIKAINKGLLGFKVRPYIDKTYGKKCYSVEFVDLPYVPTNDSTINYDPPIEKIDEDDLPF